jgi:hypothetical protein
VILTYIDEGYTPRAVFFTQMYTVMCNVTKFSGALIFTKNPLSSSFVFPAWFFGVSFGNKNRFVLLLIDAFFASLILFLLFFGAVLEDTEQVKVIQTVLTVVFFGSFVASGLYFGLGGILWTDSIFSTNDDDDDNEVFLLLKLD